MPMGFLGDSDPRDEEFQPECQKCSDLLVQDFWQEWFCPTCAKEQEEVQP